MMNFATIQPNFNKPTLSVQNRDPYSAFDDGIQMNVGVKGPNNSAMNFQSQQDTLDLTQMSLEMFGNQSKGNHQAQTQQFQPNAFEGQGQPAPVQKEQKNMGFDEFSLL